MCTNQNGKYIISKGRILLYLIGIVFGTRLIYHGINEIHNDLVYALSSIATGCHFLGLTVLAIREEILFVMKVKRMNKQKAQQKLEEKQDKDLTADSRSGDNMDGLTETIKE